MNDTFDERSASTPQATPHQAGGGAPDPHALSKATFFVTGRVQGVGFRWWVKSRALELGLQGFARNLEDRRVEVVAQGPREAVEQLGALLRAQPPQRRRPGHVRAVMTQWGEPRWDLGRFHEQ